MCGRFSLAISNMDELVNRFHALPCPMSLAPHYNLAPSQETLTIVNWQSKKQIIQMKWGLIPYWAKKNSKPYPLINVRSESIIQKTIYKPYYEKQRCLIPADGFFEWRSEDASKIPFRAVVKNEKIFAFAGLWERVNLADGTLQNCFTLITTEANSLIYPIHDRMPVILSREAEDAWLNQASLSLDEIKPFLKPYSAEEMEVYEVSKEVNSTRNDNPKCIVPVRHLA